MLMENFNVNDVISIMINYGDYSHVREGVIVETKDSRYLVEYIFWGPYDEDPQKYQQWCTSSELTLIKDKDKINTILEEHNTFTGKCNYDNHDNQL